MYIACLLRFFSFILFPLYFCYQTILNNYNFMKKNLLCLVMLAFSLFLILPAYSQIVTERIVSTPFSKAVFKSSFNKENYEEHASVNGMKTYTKKQMESSLKASEGDVTLTIQFEYDPAVYYPSAIMVINEAGYDNTQYKEESNTLELSVPRGKYDIFSDNWRIDTDMGNLVYVIKEQVEINADTTIIIRPADATNHVVTESYNEKGELMEPGVLSEDKMNIIGGNIVDMLCSCSIIQVSTGYELSSFSGDWPFKFEENGESNLDFYISDISDRYAVAQSRIAIDTTGLFYFNKYVYSDIINSSIILKNNPEDYVLHKENFQISPKGKDTETHYPALCAKSAWNGKAVGGGWNGYTRSKEYNDGKGVAIYLNNPVTDTASPQGYDLLVSVGIVDQIKTVTYDWGDGEIQTEEVASSTLSTPLVIGQDKEIIYGYYGADFGNFSFLITEDGEIIYLPFHSKFTFDSNDHPNITLGNNVPVMSCIAQNYYNEYYQSKVSFIIPQYIGRYGENKQSDYDSTFVVVKHNNAEVFSGKQADFETYDWLFGLTSEGLLDITFNNLNVEVDGLQGKNYTRLLYDQTKEDWTPPTVQMLQFRNTAGKVTDRFQSPAEGTVRLAAGDFEFHMDTHFYFAYNEGNSVQFSYAPYNTTNWAELPLTKDPEYFVMPAFGDYYEASLSSMNLAENTNWYDVRIVCTDAAGNSQEQIISPAFKIGGETKLNTPAYSRSQSFIHNNTLQVDSSVAETVEVYSLTGLKVLSAKKDAGKTTIGTNYLPQGVYIVKGSSGWVDKVLNLD
jgi:hypothetical protein